MIQLSTNVLSGRLALGAIVFAEAVVVLEELARHEFGLGKAVGLAVEHMPDGDQEFAGNRNDGLVATQARSEALEFGLPVRVGNRSRLSWTA